MDREEFLAAYAQGGSTRETVAKTLRKHLEGVSQQKIQEIDHARGVIRSNLARQEKIVRLKERSEWSEKTAAIWVDDDGFCYLCHLDLLPDQSLDYRVRIAVYDASVVEHVLPKSVYPEYKDDPRNARLACRFCNRRKGRLDVSPSPPVDTQTQPA